MKKARIHVPCRVCGKDHKNTASSSICSLECSRIERTNGYGKSMPKHDESELDAIFDVPKTSPTGRSKFEKQRKYMLSYGASARTIGKTLFMDIDKAREMHDNFHKTGNFKVDNTKELNDKIPEKDLSELEKRVVAGNINFDFFSSKSLAYPYLCSETFLKSPTKPKEKLMDLKITRPVLVGTTNILTAPTFTLDEIIREAQEQIKANEDLQSLSQHHRNIKAELEEVITLCVKQLDKGLEVKPLAQPAPAPMADYRV